jgi:hypothetical protein
LKAYKDADPSVQHQKAIPFALIRQMVTRQTTSPMLTVLHQLFLLGFFFAMRSCEYLLVTGPKRRTQPIKKKSFTFILDGKVLPHDSRYLSRADSVSVTFEFQKRDDRNDVVTQCATGDPVFCPVKVAARIVQRLVAMHASDETPIYTYVRSDGRVGLLDSATALVILRDFIKGEGTPYGLSAKDIGLHSFRSSAAMAMYLANVPVFTIMLLGRWSSDAFLRYIRPQVQQFSENVARKMIARPAFFHVPDANSTAATSVMASSRCLPNRNTFDVWGNCVRG